MNFKLRLGLIMACLLFLFACQKEEILEQPPIVEDSVMLEEIIGTDPLLDKFFNGIADHDIVVNLSNEAEVNKIKLAMAKDHQETAFVRDYVRQVGFPLWGQANLHYLEGNRQLYVLPFAKSTSSSVNAILYIFTNEDEFVYELALRSDVTNYLVEYDHGTNDFYWENLLSFVVNFIVYDDAIFNFVDDQIYDWLEQNEDTYLTIQGDTRDLDCQYVLQPACLLIKEIALQENGHERSCNEGYYATTVLIRVCYNGSEINIDLIGPHEPGGQTGGVPSLGGGGGPANSGGYINPNNDPPTNPGIDPSTWGDEGSNLPSIISPELICDFAISSFLQAHGLQSTAELRDALSNISGCDQAGSREEFNEEALLIVENMLEDCIGPFYTMLPTLGIESLGEMQSFCTDPLPSTDLGPPNCEGCSVGESHIIAEDEQRALQMLDCAIEKLDQFDGIEPQEVRDALYNNFGGTSSTAVAAYISFLFEHIRRYPYPRKYQIQNNGEGGCGDGVAAWTFPVVHFTDVRLCNPTYWNLTDIDRSVTLIHEWTHLYYFAGDIAYIWQGEFNDLNSIQQLFNADAFSELVKELCDE